MYQQPLGHAGVWEALSGWGNLFKASQTHSGESSSCVSRASQVKSTVLGAVGALSCQTHASLSGCSRARAGDRRVIIITAKAPVALTWCFVYVS